MMTRNNRHGESNRAWPVGLAVATMVLGVLALTLAGSWVEARWPNAAGEYIAVTPQSPADAAEVLWQLRRLDGVQDAVAVFRGDLVLDETLDTGWTGAWLYANQTDTPALAFLPPDPTRQLWQGRLPAPESLDEAVLGYELAQNLGLKVGDLVRMQNRSFTVVGIWGPSPRVPGNWAQVSAAAAEAILPSSPDHFVVVPVDVRETTDVARRIWQKMPDMEVLSPEWEMARARREHRVLGAVFGAAVAFLLLLAVPAWAADATGHEGATMLAAILSGAGGWVAAWAIITLANLYAQRTLGLTPLQVTPRLVVAALAMAGLVPLLGALPLRKWWPLRYAATALLLTLCAATLVLVGALSESLHLSLSEAQRAAADWVTLMGVTVDQRLLQAMTLVPGIRGYMVEAEGGFANEDEQRWLGPTPSSGVFYGVSNAGGEGTLTVPYRLGYWRGGPLDPDKLNEAVVGYDLAQAQGLTVGDTVEIRGIPFTVVGIRELLRYDPSSGANDRMDISLSGLRRVLRQPSASGEMTLLIPPAESQEEKAAYLRDMATRLNVPMVLTAEDRLAQIARSYPAAWTLTSASASEAVRHAQVSYGNGVLVCGLLLLAAGALSVSATMTDRLAQDEQRVGLLQALGSDEGALLGKYLQMAAVLGVLAALLGIGVGWGAVSYLNGWGPVGSPELIFTPRLGAGVFFAVAVTAMAAAVAPTADAVRRDAAWPLYSSAPPAELMAGRTPEAARGQVVQGGSVS